MYIFFSLRGLLLQLTHASPASRYNLPPCPAVLVQMTAEGGDDDFAPNLASNLESRPDLSGE